MLAIYIPKKLVDSIHDFSNLVATGDSGDFALIFAEPTSFEMVGPFIHVDALKEPSTEADKSSQFIRVKIQAAYVSAILHLTEAESKKIGFHAKN